MKRLFMVLVIMGLTVCLVPPAFCEDEKYDYDKDYGYHMMRPGYGWGSGHMMDMGPQGRGMHGWGLGHRPRAWWSMKPEQREKWKKMRATYLMETLELRKQLSAKQVELKTLWAQPNLDESKVKKLSDEVAEIRAELLKKRDKYLMQCRQEFGDQGWTCPGAGGNLGM